MKASLQIQPMYCSRDYNCSSRFNQQYEKSTPKPQVEYYEKTVYDILEKDIGLILPKFKDREKNINQRCQKRQIISALISGFIGLAFEGIPSFLQHK